MIQENRASNGPDRTAPQLGSCWSLSESYQSTGQRTSSNYHQSNHIIFEISTLEKLAMLWNNTDYSYPSRLFYDHVKNNIRKFRISEADEEEKILEGIMLFRKGVKPEWEDPENRNGCSYECSLENLTPEKIDALWQSLLLALVGEEFPFSNYITGIRFLDRLKKFNSVKIELWLSISKEEPKQGTETFFRHRHIIDSIFNRYLELLNKTYRISEHNLTKKEHKINLRVN